MSDDQKKKDGAAGNDGGKLPGPLPGLGGAKPGGAAPLPGLGGPKPGGALPGLGGGSPLPGMGGSAPKPVVPPFMQQAEPEQPAGPSKEAVARDPFGAQSLPEQRTSYIPAEAGLLGGGGDAGPGFSEAEAGGSKKPLFVGGGLITIICLLLGFMGGNAISGRVALNIAIRDALITQYELKKAKTLFEGTAGVINSAWADANQKKYNGDHLKYLAGNIKGNPVNARLFTDRNYKSFDISAVQWLGQYFNGWGELYSLIEDHRRMTANDEKALKAAGEEFKKLLTTQYGIVLSRSDKTQGMLEANLVILGVTSDDKGTTMIEVQTDTGTYGDKRALYNSKEPGDVELTKEPEKWAILVGANSKAGILQKATQSHFTAYRKRLDDIKNKISALTEIQTNLLQKIDEICSQDPVSFLGGIDVFEEVEAYIANDKKSAAEAG